MFSKGLLLRGIKVCHCVVKGCPCLPFDRVAEKRYVDDIVRRLTKRSSIRSNPRGCDHYQRGFLDDELEEEMLTPRTPVSRRRIRGIVNRLSQPNECCRRHPSPDLREDDYLPNFKI